MKNKTLYLIISLVLVFITGSLFRVALEEGIWKTFFVTEFQVVVTAITLFFLLREERS